MISNSSEWNISKNKSLDIIHMVLTDILLESKNNIINLKDLVQKMNTKSKIYKFSNKKKLNTLSKYIKFNHGDLIGFIENYNHYDIIKQDKNVYIKLYKHLINMNNINSSKRLTKDSEWEIIT